jgi:hypothetical protein
MATYEAVGAVGLTLQALLADRVEHPSGNGDVVPVTLGPPGPERDPEGAAEAPRINLFLFRVSENPFLRNQEIPGEGSRGAYGQPPLTLDLHYLLTVFGASANGPFFDETPAHRLLGSAMRALHDHAIITDAVTTRRSPAGAPVLHSALRGEHERIKLTLQPLALEDLTNVWTSLELSYRLSVAYEVSVVQIESQRPRRYPRPVQEPPGAGPRVYAAPLRRPRILSIAVRRVGDQPNLERPVPFARVGDTLVIRGSDFGGGGLRIRLGAVEVPPALASDAGDRLEVIVPDDQLPDGTPIPPASRLQPGPHLVEVAAAAAELPGVALGSGRAVFVLVPAVASATISGRTLDITGTRLLAEDLAGQVVIGNAVVERADYLPASTAAALSLTLPTALPAFPVAARASGDLAPFPSIPPQFDVRVTIGGQGPETATLAGTPGSIAEAATLLEAAIRAAHDSHPFRGARVGATADGLVVIPGDLTSAVSFQNGALANALRLASGSAARQVYLSGVLRPFPSLSASAPAVELELAGVTAAVALGSVPTSLEAAAAALESGIRSADPAPAFAGARVARAGDRLCLLPGAAGAVAFGPSADDADTAAELQLAGPYLLRVRVGGVESVEEVYVELPA